MPKRQAERQLQSFKPFKVPKASNEVETENVKNAAGLSHRRESTDAPRSEHMVGGDLERRSSIDDDGPQLSTGSSSETTYVRTSYDSVKPLIVAFSETFKDRLVREEVKGRALKLLMAGILPEEVASMLEKASEGSFTVTVASTADWESVDTGV